MVAHLIYSCLFLIKLECQPKQKANLSINTKHETCSHITYHQADILQGVNLFLSQNKNTQEINIAISIVQITVTGTEKIRKSIQWRPQERILK